jgi:hypothetical protein
MGKTALLAKLAGHFKNCDRRATKDQGEVVSGDAD